MPYGSPVRSETRRALMKVWTEESGSWNDVNTTEVTSEDCEHVGQRNFACCMYTRDPVYFLKLDSSYITVIHILQPTAGFVTYVTCRLTARNRDQLRNPTLGNRVWATGCCMNSTCFIQPVVLLAAKCNHVSQRDVECPSNRYF